MKPIPEIYVLRPAISLSRIQLETPLSTLINSTVSSLNGHTCSMWRITRRGLARYVPYSNWHRIINFVIKCGGMKI